MPFPILNCDRDIRRPQHTTILSYSDFVSTSQRAGLRPSGRPSLCSLQWISRVRLRAPQALAWKPLLDDCKIFDPKLTCSRLQVGEEISGSTWMILPVYAAMVAALEEASEAAGKAVAGVEAAGEVSLN